jgi:hypothetical protein
MLRTAFLISVFALAASVASAQSSMSSGQRNNQLRVSLTVQIFVVAPTDSSPEALKAQEDARRKVYEIATRECALLLDVIASDCRLENVNVNVNRYHNPQQPQGFNINGSMNFRVTMK